MGIFNVGSETYDKTWYVKADTGDRALELVIKLTENLGWHLDVSEEPDWEVREVFTKNEEVIEWRDM